MSIFNEIYNMGWESIHECVIKLSWLTMFPMQCKKTLSASDQKPHLTCCHDKEAVYCLELTTLTQTWPLKYQCMWVINHELWELTWYCGKFSKLVSCFCCVKQWLPLCTKCSWSRLVMPKLNNNQTNRGYWNVTGRYRCWSTISRLRVKFANTAVSWTGQGLVSQESQLHKIPLSFLSECFMQQKNQHSNLLNLQQYQLLKSVLTNHRWLVTDNDF